MKARGAIAFSGEMSCDPTGTVDLLELRAESFDILGGFGPGVGVAIYRPVTDFNQIVFAKCDCHRIGLAKIPSFKFLANNAYQGVGVSGLLAKVPKPLLDCNAVSSVAVSDDHEAIAWGVPPAELAADTEFKVVFALVGNTQER